MSAIVSQLEGRVKLLKKEISSVKKTAEAAQRSLNSKITELDIENKGYFLFSLKLLLISILVIPLSLIFYICHALYFISALKIKNSRLETKVCMLEESLRLEKLLKVDAQKKESKS
jgi:hypothetical protein